MLMGVLVVPGRGREAVKLTDQTGARGFGLFAAEDISEGDFVTDYRGDVSAPFF
jgi:hypothetical protein